MYPLDVPKLRILVACVSTGFPRVCRITLVSYHHTITPQSFNYNRTPLIPDACYPYQLGPFGKHYLTVTVLHLVMA
jgi:hypothetical protein